MSAVMKKPSTLSCHHSANGKGGSPKRVKASQKLAKNPQPSLQASLFCNKGSLESCR
jgi:hypothetical protein